MAMQVTTITMGESRRRKPNLQCKLKELRDTSSQREELRIDYVAGPLDQVKSSTDRRYGGAVPRSANPANSRHSISPRQNRNSSKAIGCRSVGAAVRLVPLRRR